MANENGNFWDTETALTEFEVNPLTKIRVSAVTKGERESVQIRTWVQLNNGEFVPTKKGLVIPATMAVSVAEAMMDAEKVFCVDRVRQ